MQAGCERAGWCGAVLGVSIVVEGYSLLVATRAVLQGAQAMGITFWEYLRRGMDPTTVAVMMEDGAAVTGLLIAGALPPAASPHGLCSLCHGAGLTTIAVVMEDAAAVTGLLIAGALTPAAPPLVLPAAQPCGLTGPLPCTRGAAARQCSSQPVQPVSWPCCQGSALCWRAHWGSAAAPRAWNMQPSASLPTGCLWHVLPMAGVGMAGLQQPSARQFFVRHASYIAVSQYAVHAGAAAHVASRPCSTVGML